MVHESSRVRNRDEWHIRRKCVSDLLGRGLVIWIEDGNHHEILIGHHYEFISLGPDFEELQFIIFLECHSCPIHNRGYDSGPCLWLIGWGVAWSADRGGCGWTATLTGAGHCRSNSGPLWVDYNDSNHWFVSAVNTAQGFFDFSLS